MTKFAAMICVLLATTIALAETIPSLPAGTVLKMKLEKTLSTFSSKGGDPFTGRITEAVVLGGKTVTPNGATVEGRVTKVNQPRRIAGNPTIGLLPEVVVLPNGQGR